MIGAGTVISPIIKIVTTVAVLAAIYLLFVRPILDTAERTAGDFSDSPGVVAVEQAERDLQNARRIALSQANSMLAGSQPWRAASNEIKDCVRRAGTAIVRVERCQRVAQRISTGVLSNRNFAVSYATSLAGQGRGADAARVRACVEDAGFDPAKMASCRTLGNRLLFG